MEEIVEGSSVLGLVNVDCVVSPVGVGDLLGVVDLVTLTDSSKTLFVGDSHFVFILSSSNTASLIFS